MIAESIEKINGEIREICEKCGRSRDDVTLIAVSKTKPVSDIEEALKTGTLDFGENKVQELCSKCEVLPENIRWHLIGHLQRNKVKYVAGKTALIHSVDSLRLAEKIEEESAKREITTDILIEVNVSGEESKFGVSPDETEGLVRQIAKMEHVRVRGLMTIAPYTSDPENNRGYFRALRQLSVDIKQKNIDNVCMNELSMGMSGDYRVAIEEGATFVRVGTAIFGERNYTT